MSEVLTGGIDVTLVMLLWLLAAGALAGWIDAVVGGGGLIQLPALLLVPGISPLQALATNKVAIAPPEAPSAVASLPVMVTSVRTTRVYSCAEMAPPAVAALF